MKKLLPVIIEIDQRRFEIHPDELQNLNCTQLSDDLYQLNDGGKTYTITLLEFDLISGFCLVSIDGSVKKIKIFREIDTMIEKMGLNVSHSNKLETLIAPMPGLVTDIKVIPDQHVEKGAPLIILEAMKMENVIAAPHDAIVKSITVKIGQAVDKGFTLIEFA